LIPTIVQDARNGRVLMLGWMNPEALERTRATGEVWFWSRSRRALWHKGETSGNVLRVREIRADCDADCLLIRAEPLGPTCHTGRPSCFWQSLDADAAPLDPPAATFLDELEQLIAQRREAAPESSYTARLFADGVARIAQKVGEEGVEAALAGVSQGDERLIEESADLIYHLLVLLQARGLRFESVVARLEQRHAMRAREQASS
ncbi:MAG: bifunctional phosphoribosyl-AMP cyclohydrolase/phosphoribosyl-ATP diphosphatase HisIE, partial [Thermoflexales bacterium]|nr:bifunctional phosphoribosyl-AMP cyclohydrolase/phosphoribosyl-ATP diphosphatase HisIE [Thermoflexales bacterium]